MKAYDFSYNGVRLSDIGYTICKFDGGGVETVSNGSEITFNTIPSLNGQVYHLTSSSYEDCITATLQICKNQCDGHGMEISIQETRDIMKWLNSKTFQKLRFIDYDGEFTGIYFMASFNVSRIEVDGRIMGFELEVFTDRPHALQDPVTISIDNPKPNVVKSFFSKSDEAGFVYPNMKIEIKQDGDLTIRSITEDRTTVIKDCKNGEVITIDYPMIKSSSPSHNKTIMNNFNWVFYRVSTTFKDSKNEFTASLPCSIALTYSPIAKVGI